MKLPRWMMPGLFVGALSVSYGNETQRTEIFKRIVAFLETNLGPGVP